MTDDDIMILKWHDEARDGKPKLRGKFLLVLDNGDYSFDGCYIPGSQWCCISTVVRWARLP